MAQKPRLSRFCPRRTFSIRGAAFARGATELEEAAPRRVWSMPLEHVDGEELVTSGPRPYLRFESSAPYSEGVFEVHCAIPDQQQATQAMIRTFFVLLGCAAPSRRPVAGPRPPLPTPPRAQAALRVALPATLEPVEGACEGAGAETCSLAPALALAPAPAPCSATTRPRPSAPSRSRDRDPPPREGRP
eukprot:tig00021612_g22860.t1